MGGLSRFHPVRGRLRRNPKARLQSPLEVAIAAEMGLGVDANRATLDDWLRLPGISIHQARTLVTLAGQGVGFHCLEDVAAALGLPVGALTAIAVGIQFHYYGGDELTPVPIPVNQATPGELGQVPGLSPEWADWLVRSRQERPFRDWADLQQRGRIPADLLARWLHYLKI